MNPKVDEYLKKAKAWRKEMELLREVILEYPLTEDLKWGKPTYAFGESNMLILQPFKESVALMFFKGVLLKDPDGRLGSPGENSQSAKRILFRSSAEITKTKSVLKAFIKEAIELEKSGQKVEFKTSPEPFPEELQAKMADDAKFKAAFAALTPGRQRGYILFINGAKQSKTRADRIEKFVPQILEGRGLHDPPTKSSSKDKGRAGAKTKSAKGETGEKAGVVLLSGGNPQIAKGDGDPPVQAYIAAMPGWKHEIGKSLDAIITRTVPKVKKAVKWNSPFYGMEGQGWFLSCHVLTKYVRVTFFNGVSLKPLPPGFTEKSGEGRWVDIYEDAGLDEKQMKTWVKQSAALPGWKP